MVEKKPHCNSCKRSLLNQRGSVSFPCPGCRKEEILRCFACRELATKYTCNQCGFVGPN